MLNFPRQTVNKLILKTRRSSTLNFQGSTSLVTLDFIKLRGTPIDRQVVVHGAEVTFEK